MCRAVLGTTGDEADAYVNFTAWSVAGADLSFLGRKIQAPLAEAMTAVVTLSIVGCDVSCFPFEITETTRATQR